MTKDQKNNAVGMIVLDENNHSILAEIDRFQFIRVKTPEFEKFIITSGGNNPDYYLERRTYENASKAWGKVHKSDQNDQHKSYVEDLKAHYDLMVKNENNPQLPFEKDLYPDVKSYIVAHILGTEITKKALQDAFNIDEVTTYKLITRLIHNEILSAHGGPGQETTYKTKETAGPDGPTADDDLYEKVLLLVSESETISNGQLQKVFELSHAAAAEIIDRLEVAGLIGGRDGNKPRKVLANSVKSDGVNDE